MIRIANLPAEERLCHYYQVEAEGQSVPVAFARVSAMPYNTVWPGCQRPMDQTEEAGFIRLESDGAVQLKVTLADGKVPSKVLVRPLAKKVSVQISGDTCSFTLPGPGQYTLEADGFHNALHIFVDPLKDFEAQGHVIHYAAGVHKVGRVLLQSHTTVLLDPGAVVYGCFYAFNAEDVNILGYGIVDGSEEIRTSEDCLLPYDLEKQLPKDWKAFSEYCDKQRDLLGCIRLYRCRNCHVEGVTLRDSATFAFIPAGCENLVIDGVKTIGMWRYNSDGIDLFNCRNVTMKNCFLRDFDDCIVIKGIGGWDEMNNENITVERCVVWCDWGRNLEIGAETCAPEYRNIIFRDCDCIHGSTVYLDVQHHNYADIHHILFEDIRVEYTVDQLPDVYQHDMTAPYTYEAPIRYPYLAQIPIVPSGLFSLDGKNGIAHDIQFKNIQVLTDGENIPTPKVGFSGTTPQNTVERIILEAFTLDGTPFCPVLEANEFTKDIVIK